MSMRVHEIHPSVVHFPLVLVPAALALDAIGLLTRNRAMMGTARRLMPVAAASGFLAGLAGLAAQGAVRFDDRSASMLRTHRTLNVGLVLGTTILAMLRARRRQPGLAYLAAGLAGVVAMNYSAYVGGKMVYAHGVGVEPAGGVLRGESPEVRRSNLGTVARQSAANAVRSIREAVGGLRVPMASSLRH